jgi:hypothetical protein
VQIRPPTMILEVIEDRRDFASHIPWPGGRIDD